MEIQISQLCKAFGRHQVLKNVSLSACSGECIGILGVNGSGKSTMLSILAGVQRADSGSFTLDGGDLLHNRALRAQAVGFVPQLTPLIPELSARDNLLLWYTPSRLKQELDSGVLAMLGIDRFLTKQVSRLSGGMKKRLSIGCAMAHRPPVLLLDEPTAALDLCCRQDIWAWLDAYLRSGGIVVLTTHEHSELSLCDRLYILKNGQLTAYRYDGDLPRLMESL